MIRSAPAVLGLTTACMRPSSAKRHPTLEMYALIGGNNFSAIQIASEDLPTWGRVRLNKNRPAVSLSSLHLHLFVSSDYTALRIVKTNNHRIMSPTPLRPGVYAPTMTFFDVNTEDLDIASIRRHAVRLAKAGLVGLVTMGSNGEAVHLTRQERATVTRETRSALDEAGFTNVPVIAGASENSVRGTIELCQEVAAAGGEYALIVPPSYYRTAVGNDETLYEYFTAVADRSPIPLILYNYPGAVAGIDMDSDLIIRISQHPNIVGTKFTCANTGKLTRVANALGAINPPSPLAPAQRAAPTVSKPDAKHPYVAFGGIADFSIQTLVSGGSAILAGGANVVPRLCVRIFNLWAEGKLAEAMQAQQQLSDADWVLTKAAIPGTKSAIQSYYGYGGYPRRPLARLSDAQARTIADKIKGALEFELSLPDVA